jgi:hypothetical protein
MAVPYTFGSATTSIPLSQLDSNFATTITLGNTAIQLGNTVTTLNNMTLANVTITSGTSNIVATSIANGTSNVTIASSNGNISMSTNNIKAVTIDTSQNVNIAQAILLAYSSSIQYATDGALTNYASNNGVYINGNAGGFLQIAGDGTQASKIAIQGSSAATPNIIQFSTASSERARITSGGNFCVLGTDTLATLYVQNTGSAGCPSVGVLGQPQAGLYLRRQTSGDTNTNATFCIGVDDTAGAGGQPTLTVGINTGGVGALPRNISNGVKLTYNATAWASNSDKTLKDITSYITDGLNAIDQIKPIKFTWKSDESKFPCVGVIAQDVQKVIPEAVAVDNPETGTLLVKYTELIPHLIASIKELKSIVDLQATEISELKAKVGV